MSTFIIKTDYEHLIKDNVLDRITHNTDAHLDSCEEEAIALMKSYLDSRYVVDDGAGGGIFEQTGTDRHPIIVKYCLDISLYFLHNRLAPSKVPKQRKDNFDAAIKWLEQLQRGKVNPPDLPTPDDDDDNKDYVLHGGNTKRTSHI